MVIFPIQSRAKKESQIASFRQVKRVVKVEAGEGSKKQKVIGVQK